MKFSKSITIILLGCTILFVGSLLSACSPQTNFEDLEEWDLVWVSDSSGWGVAEVFAAMIEEDMGVTVNVYDGWVGELSAGEILSVLKGEKTQIFKLTNLPELIKKAEFVVIYGNPKLSTDDNNPGDWNCIGGKKYVNVCDMNIFNLYIDHLKEIYEIIFELRDGKPTIIRTFDAYNAMLVEWEQDGAFEACQACWGNYNDAIHQAANSYNIPVAAVAEAWNGPNRDEDPNDKGYTKDGIHPNETGATVIATALRDLGYEPVVP